MTGTPLRTLIGMALVHRSGRGLAAPTLAPLPGALVEAEDGTTRGPYLTNRAHARAEGRRGHRFGLGLMACSLRTRGRR